MANVENAEWGRPETLKRCFTTKNQRARVSSWGRAERSSDIAGMPPGPKKDSKKRNREPDPKEPTHSQPPTRQVRLRESEVFTRLQQFERQIDEVVRLTRIDYNATRASPKTVRCNSSRTNCVGEQVLTGCSCRCSMCIGESDAAHPENLAPGSQDRAKTRSRREDCSHAAPTVVTDADRPAAGPRA